MVPSRTRRRHAVVEFDLAGGVPGPGHEVSQALPDGLAAQSPIEPADDGVAEAVAGVLGKDLPDPEAVVSDEPVHGLLAGLSKSVWIVRPTPRIAWPTLKARSR